MEKNPGSRNPYIYGQLIFLPGYQDNSMGENSVFDKWCWDNGISRCRRMRLDLYFTPYKKLTENCSET